MRKLFIFIVLVHCFSLIYAQNTLKIENIEVLSLDSDSDKQTSVNMTFTQLTDMYCQSLSKINGGKNLTQRMAVALEPIFESRKMLDSLISQRVRTSVNKDSAEIEVLKDLMQTTFESCPEMNALLNYDGKQRPAYSHVSKLICNCLQEAKAKLIDPQIYPYKYSLIKDSCSKAIFGDEDVRKIIFTANDFQLKTEIESYDKNFYGYFFKSCSEETDLAMAFFINIWKDAAMKKNAYDNSIDIVTIRQNNMRAVINRLNSNEFSSDYRSITELFNETKLEGAVRTDLNSAQGVLKNQKNIDWIQEENHALQGITSYKLSVYKYIAQTKKRVLLCQLVFDFYDENSRQFISGFHFIPKIQIKDLQDLENRINKKY